MEHLQVPLAEGPDKVCPPSTTVTFLGIELDSQAWEMRLPAPKLLELKSTLDSWVHRVQCTKRELLSLAGSLSFAAKVVPPGRTFCRRLFDEASQFTSLDSTQRLNQEALNDISWWHACIESWNGRSLLLDPSWCKPTEMQLFTDASDRGYGLVCGKEWAYGQWEALHKDLSIEWRELFPIALICVTLGKRLRNRRLLVHCDNEAVCTIWRTGTSRCPEIMTLVRIALLAAAKHNMVVFLAHIRGVDNVLADRLSRLQVESFRKLHPQASPVPMSLEVRQLTRLLTTPWASSLREWQQVPPGRMLPV